MPNRNKKNATSSDDNGLFSEFSAVTYNQWRSEAERLLKGASFDKAMLTETDEGIVLKPMYRKEDIEPLEHVHSYPGFAPFVRGNNAYTEPERRWQVAQQISSPDSDSFNAILMQDMKRGLTAVSLPLDYASTKGLDPDEAGIGDVGFGGVSIASVKELETALADVDLAEFPVYLQVGSTGLPYFAFYISLARRNGISPEHLHGAIATDPIGDMAAYGKLPAMIDMLMDDMAIMTAWAVRKAPHVGTIWNHGEIYHNRGANAVQELACVMATAVYYLRQMEKRQIEPEQAIAHFRFSFGVGSHIFMEISKLRAARLLWSRILQLCNFPDSARKMWVHVQSSKYNKTIYDPYVNMLRCTTEAFAGVIGGADSMSVSPFDECLKESDDFSRRIARNTHIILREEAHLAQAIDPAGGSWYVETLTAELADAAWELFRRIEKAGGIYDALKNGMIQDMVAESSKKKADALAVRKKTAIGTNKYPNPAEKRPNTQSPDYEEIYSRWAEEMRRWKTSPAHSGCQTALEELAKISPDDPNRFDVIMRAADKGATVGEIIHALRGRKPIQVEMAPLPSQRQSVSIETLRMAVESHQDRHGNVIVFLAALGPASRYMPRLDFAASFFEVGGFTVLRTDGFNTPEQAAEEAIAHKADVVVICGLDEAYESGAPIVARKVKAANDSAIVVLAGKPKDDALQTSFEKAGIDMFIHLRSNIPQTLKSIARKQGVSV